MTTGRECANCGRELPEVGDPHRRGRNLYCSYGCLAEAATIPRKKWKPPWAWLRRIAFTVVVIAALAAGFRELRSAVDATPTKAIASTKKHRVSRAHLALGSRGRPVPTGKMASIGSDWRMTVLSVRPDVSQVALGLGRQPLLPPGTQNYLVRVKLRFLGHKSDKVLSAIVAINATGPHHAYYTADVQCNPPDRLNFPHQGVWRLRSGKSTVGSLCFLISSRDAPKLRLYAYPPDSPGFRIPTRRVWFELK